MRARPRLDTTTTTLVLAMSWGLAAAADPPPAAPAAPVPTPAAPAAPALPAAPFDRSAAAPAFAGTAAARTAALVREGKWAEVAAGLEKATAAGTIKAPERGRAALALGRAYIALKRWNDARSALAEAGKLDPLLLPYAQYYGAFAAYHAGDRSAAAALAGAVDHGAPIDNDARLLAGDALWTLGQGKLAEVATLYEGVLKDYPRSIRLSEVRFRLAEAYRKLGRPALAEMPLLRAIWIEDPLSSFAAKAEARLQAISPKAADGSQTWLRWTAAELTTRAHALFDAMRNPESEAGFIAALAAPGASDVEVACDASFHLAQSVFKQRQRARAAPLFDAALVACNKSKNVDLQMKAGYQAGRTHASAGEYEAAITAFLAAEAAHPEHSYADDARLRAAEAATELKDDARVTELLSTLPVRYPEGDMRGEALWRLAFRDYRAKKWTEALGWLDKQIAAVPHEPRWDAEGQALYWKARVLTKLGRPRNALAAYQQTVREYPLSFYALLALRRMSAGERKKMLAEVQRTPPAAAITPEVAPALAKLSFAPRPAYADPRFQRAIALLTIGFGDDAARELGAAGFKPPSERGKQVPPDEAERLWATTLLYDSAQAWSQSHWIPRHTTVEYKRAWPIGDNRLRWRLSYPLGYIDLLAAEAKTLGHPAMLAMAHVREESAFDPVLESFANAIGLMQMIFSTGSRFARGTGLTATRETLRDPKSNVIIGSRFLNFLWKRYKGNPGLTVPAYNAGEGAVDKWLRARGDLELDEFLETIPYDETRGYSKRVLNSYFVYRYLDWLDAGAPAKVDPVPELSFKLR